MIRMRRLLERAVRAPGLLLRPRTKLSGTVGGQAAENSCNSRNLGAVHGRSAYLSGTTVATVAFLVQSRQTRQSGITLQFARASAGVGAACEVGCCVGRMLLSA